MKLAPMTELDAVNLMLSVIGEAPVNTIEVTGLGDVAVARTILNEVSREVQERGWGFNTEDDYELPLTVEGEIRVPPNALRIDSEDSEQVDVVARGPRIYDKANKTYTFSKPIKFQIVFMLDYIELPQAARYYIAVRSARKFVKRVVGSDLLEAFTKEDEFAALSALQDQDCDVTDYNFLTGNPDTARILRR